MFFTIKAVSKEKNMISFTVAVPSKGRMKSNEAIKNNSIFRQNEIAPVLLGTLIDIIITCVNSL